MIPTLPCFLCYICDYRSGDSTKRQCCPDIPCYDCLDSLPKVVPYQMGSNFGPTERLSFSPQVPSLLAGLVSTQVNDVNVICDCSRANPQVFRVGLRVM